MWVARRPSSGSGGVFNGVNGLLHIKYADRGTKRKKMGGGARRMVLGPGRNVWSNVCKLDAVIDYRLLSLTARHMETVTVFRYAYANMPRYNAAIVLALANAHQFLRPVLFDSLLSLLPLLLFPNFQPCGTCFE